MKTRLFFLLCLTPMLGLAQTQIGNDIDGVLAGDNHGSSVSLSADGSVVATGGSLDIENGPDVGYVSVYESNAGNWTQIGENIFGETDGDGNGGSISLSADGSVLAIGAAGNNGNGSDAGQVRVFENNAGIWTQIGSDIDGENAGDVSGCSVSLSADGNIIAIGSRLNDENGIESGHVRVFQNIADTWTQLGSNINGEAAGDRSGHRVSLSADGSVVAIGAFLNEGNGSASGHVRVYQNNGGNWTQIGADIDGEAGESWSGFSVSLSSDGDVVAIGSSGNGNDATRVKVYRNNAGTWDQVGEDIDNESIEEESGYSISLSADGTVLAIGAPRNDDNGTWAGQVRVYQNIADSWIQVGADIDGEAAEDMSGWSISLSEDGTVVAIGAPLNDGNGEDAGHVRVYDLSIVLSSDHFVQANFKVYPNPTADFVNVQLSEGLQLERVNVYSASGQLVKTERNPAFSVNDLAKGTYILEVVTDQGKAAKTIIVE